KINFIFAGNGPLEDEVLKIKNIKNVGFVSGQELEMLIRKAMFSICPSECYENCPFSVMESQIFGTPVIGANIGGVPELILVNKTGELFESKNENDLKAKIENFYNDKEKLVEYTKNCENVEFETMKSYVEKLMLIYK
ncbi:MAG: glycosyltransferase, partial [Oscillospiraceae bacterium]